MAARASTCSSCRASGTRMRVWATQAWPLFMSPATLTPSATAVRVGVVEDDGGRLAAELEVHPAEGAAADGGRPARPAAVEPVKVTLSTPGWATRWAPTSPPPGRMLTTPGGQADLVEDLGQEQGVERGLGRRLDHHGAAGEQGRDELADDQELRHVPRDDRADDADGLLAQEHVCAVGAGPALLPRVLRGDAGEGAEHRPGQRGLGQLGERDRRAHLGGDQGGHLLAPGAVSVGQAGDGGDALAGSVRGQGPWSIASRAAATARSTSAGPAAAAVPTTSSECGDTTAITPPSPGPPTDPRRTTGARGRCWGRTSLDLDGRGTSLR